MTRSLPGLVIAGAPKCGTGSLFTWLSTHPGVCASQAKETYYLMDRDSALFAPKSNIHEHGVEGYAQLFAHCRDGALCMEATPDYLYQKGAPHFLAGLDQPPLVLFSLRKPSERTYSAYRFFQGNLAVLPKEMTFTDYVRRLRAGESFPGRLGSLVAGALEHSAYASHCLRWAKILGREHLRFIIFEDMVRDPGQALIRLCPELGLDPAPFSDFDFAPHNVSIRVRSQFLHRWRNRVAEMLPSGRYRRMTSRVYRFLNHDPRPHGRSKADIQTLRELDEFFLPDTGQLAEAFGLDLRAWATPPGDQGLD